MDVYLPEDLVELYETGKSKEYTDVERNPKLYSGFVRAIKIMNHVDNVSQLKNYSYLHYEKLKHEYSGITSVRLANGFVHRLLFTENEDGIKVTIITIDDTHYGNK